jgi:amidophosphoribosyltransferase
MLTTLPFDSDDDHLKEECALFGIFNHPDAAALTVLGLHALQHRGQEASGIVTCNSQHFHAHRALGLVGDTFADPAVMKGLKGNAAIGHNRYATTGDTVLRNVQPLYFEFDFGGFALGHNGNLTNALQLRRQLIRRGSLFQSTTDTETIFHLMATAPGGSVLDRIVEALRQVEGAYSLVCLAEGVLMGVRDPNGVRPLVLGKLGDSFVLASETCALDIIGAAYLRDIEPGELVVIDSSGVHSIRPFGPAEHRFCIFEYIYFARPDSRIENRSVYQARERIGAELAGEAGVAAQSGIPFELGIIRNHYVGRTFIEPTDQIRNFGVKLKHNANRSILEGKRVILVDDSIVRGTTSTKIVEMVRQAGATEVHMRISSPPTTHSCFYGIDTPEQEKLLAHRYSVEEMAKFIGADSLAFISIDGLYRAMGEVARDTEHPQFCDACFTGDYPIAVVDRDRRGAQPELTLLFEGRA